MSFKFFILGSFLVCSSFSYAAESVVKQCKVNIKTQYSDDDASILTVPLLDAGATIAINSVETSDVIVQFGIIDNLRQEHAAVLVRQESSFVPYYYLRRLNTKSRTKFVKDVQKMIPQIIKACNVSK
jgi:hypothetical protein